MRPHIGWRFGTLLASMIFLALAVRDAPGLRGADVMRTTLGESTLEFSPYVPLLVGAFALAVAGTLVRKARFLVYATLTGGLGWALAGATQLPLWLIGQRLGLIAKPEPNVVLLGALSIAVLLIHLFIDGLQEYHDASVQRGVPLNLVEWDQRRIAITYVAAVTVVFVLALLLSGLFQGPFEGAGWVPPLSGEEWGAWVLILVAVLLGGVLLVLGVHEKRVEDKPKN